MVLEIKQMQTAEGICIYVYDYLILTGRYERQGAARFVTFVHEDS
jgi:hypothetical protein